ncbi:LysR substrate-binding domain-containing protein [Aestuariirhabdus sp. Z083]|nr:LysR substrate-binding domain-containing protein [Aestuariirhabdus haliotis]
MISLKQLSYAVAAGETLHFKQAAEQCNVSQSTFSTGLAELEKQLGVQIFERDNKKVLVTPLGAEVLERARTILLQATDLQQLADSRKAPLNYPLSVGVIPTIAPYLLPKMLPHLQQTYPQAQLNIVEEQSHELVHRVRTGSIDTAILALPYPHEGLLNLEFWQEDFYWVALKGARHTEQTSITSNELDPSDLLLLQEGHCLKDHILDACKLPQPPSNHGFGASSLNTIIQMVLGKMGTTLIPAMALDQLSAQNESLSAVHLKESSPHRRIAFIFRPNYTRLSSIEALAEVCRYGLEH